MIEESIEDFKRRYKDTFVFITINEKEHLVRFDGTSESETNFYFWSPSFGNVVVSEEIAKRTLVLKFPNTGLHNINNSVVCLARNPARQWKRAPCSDNTSIINPLRSTLGLNENPPRWVPELVEQLFTPKFPNVSLDNLKIESKFIALNHTFGISDPKITYTHLPIFWYRESPIGYLDKNTKTIDLKHDVFKQETTDFLRKTNPEWTLKSQP